MNDLEKLNKLNEIVRDIRYGYGWISVNYLFNQVKDNYDLSNFEILHLSKLLADEDMLVDDTSELFKGNEELLNDIHSGALVIL